MSKIPLEKKVALAEKYLPELKCDDLPMTRFFYLDKHTEKHIVSSKGTDVKFDYQTVAVVALGGVKYSGSINDEGEMRGRLDYSKLYLYKEIYLKNTNFEMPYYSATGNRDMKELLYKTLKSSFALALRFLQLGCIEQGNINMANFGFVNF